MWVAVLLERLIWTQGQAKKAIFFDKYNKFIKFLKKELWLSVLQTLLDFVLERRFWAI